VFPNSDQSAYSVEQQTGFEFVLDECRLNLGLDR